MLDTYFTSELSLWFILLCAAAGWFAAYLLYRKDKKLEETPSIVKKILFGLRWASISLIAFLLLNPVVNTQHDRIEKPLIIFAQDNSASLREERQKIKELIQKTDAYFSNKKQNFSYKKLSFGESVKKIDTLTLNEPISNFSEVIEKVNRKYSGQNIGALIIAGDGIFNAGGNPVYSLKNNRFPVYTIPLGDTTLYPDFKINTVKYNKIAFLNNTYPLQINLSASKMQQVPFELRIYDNGTQVFKQAVSIPSKEFFKKITVKLKAKTKGFHKLRIIATSKENEKNLYNNEKQIVVKVKDSKKKILLLAHAPHPDISAIRQALQHNRNFELDFFTLDQFHQSIKGYNLVILHQIPSRLHPASKILSNLKKNNIPTFYILGNQSNLKAFDNLETGLTTGNFSNAPDLAKGKLNEDFALFHLNPGWQDFIDNAPPVSSVFGDYKTSSNARILMNKQINKIETKNPLLLFTDQLSRGKQGVLAAEGIWRWRLANYRMFNNHYLFNELINSIIQYMSKTSDLRKFRIITRELLPENQTPKFKAEIFDEDYKPITDATIQLKISDSTHRELKNYVLKNKNGKYLLTAQQLPPGDYYWTARSKYAGKKYQDEGFLCVLPLEEEFRNLRADHHLLAQTAHKGGGKMYYPENLEHLFKDLENNENIVATAHREQKSENVTHYKFLFFLILLFLTSEWALRKYFGTV